MSGNSEYASQKAAEILEADLIRLDPVKAYPSTGVRKFLWGGKSAVMGDEPELKAYDFDDSKYDRIILSFPVWASRPAPPIKTFISENLEALRDKKLAALVSFGGGGGDKAIAKLKEMLKVDTLEAELVLIEPKDKPDPEKDRQIEVFCESLK